MLIRPRSDDLRIIGYYLGKAILGLGLVQLVPLALAVWMRSWDDVSALVSGIAIAVAIGTVSDWRLHTRRDLDWAHGLVIVALAWLVGTAVLATPMHLSGHFGTYLDAYLEMMSGLTATGLSLAQDVDHLSEPMNLLRHLTHFVGGQGIVIVMLTGLASSSAQVSSLYFGEGRDDRVLPNVVRTARFLFLIAGTYLVIGTTALWLATMSAGMQPLRAAYHSLHLFMSAFDTGGFATMSTSAGYYHSLAVELVLIVLMVAGAFSFLLHFELWRGRVRELWENLEVRTLAVTGTLATTVILFGLGHAGAFTDIGSLFRQGVFSAVSAHTSTGFTINQSAQFAQWGLVAPAGLLLALALGGMASSTAGGVKAVRVGLLAKSVIRDLRRASQPDAAVVASSYVQRHRRLLTDAQVRQATTILVLYLVMFIGGAMVAVYYGYPFDQALFDSTSATVNGGISVGVYSPDMPIPMKVTFGLQMWLGRLEFMAAFALLGFGVAMVRGR